MNYGFRPHRESIMRSIIEVINGEIAKTVVIMIERPAGMDQSRPSRPPRYVSKCHESHGKT